MKTRLNLDRSVFEHRGIDDAVRKMCALDSAWSVLRALALANRDRGSIATARMAATEARGLVAAFAERQPFTAAAR